MSLELELAKEHHFLDVTASDFLRKVVYNSLDSDCQISFFKTSWIKRLPKTAWFDIIAVVVMWEITDPALWQLKWFDDERFRQCCKLGVLSELSLQATWGQAHVNKSAIRPDAGRKLDSLRDLAWSLMTVGLVMIGWEETCGRGFTPLSSTTWPGKFDSLQVLGDNGFGGELDFQRECNAISKIRQLQC